VHYVSNFGSRSLGFEYQLAHDTTPQYVAMQGALTVNNTDAYTSACLAGLGIIQVPEAGVRAYLDSGQLLEVLPDYRPASMPVSILYPNRRHVPQRVQVFMTWLASLVQPRLQI
jgi:DNA-binding transcriptional LysR family regulator